MTDETGEFEGSIRKTWSFADGILHIDDPVHENGCFRGRDAVFESVIHEKWQNRGREGGRQKRDTLERMSL